MESAFQAFNAYGLFTTILLFLVVKQFAPNRHHGLSIRGRAALLFLLPSVWLLNTLSIAKIIELPLDLFIPFEPTLFTESADEPSTDWLSSPNFSMLLITLSLTALFYLYFVQAFRTLLNRNKPCLSEKVSYFLELSIVVTLCFTLSELTGITNLYSAIRVDRFPIDQLFLPLSVSILLSIVWSNLILIYTAIRFRIVWAVTMALLYIVTISSSIILPLLNEPILWMLLPAALFCITVELTISRIFKSIAETGVDKSELDTPIEEEEVEPLFEEINTDPPLFSTPQPTNNQLQPIEPKDRPLTVGKKPRYALLLAPGNLVDEQLSEYLVQNGWHIHKAKNCNEALNILLIEHNNVLLLDLDTSDLDYPSLRVLIDHFRANHLDRSLSPDDLPIVALHELTLETDNRSHLNSLGIRTFFEKPVDAESVLVAMDEHFIRQKILTDND